MAEFFPPVLFEVRAKATEAIATFGTVNKELEKMQINGELAGTKLGGLQKASKFAGTALMGLAGTFAVFATASVRETLKVEDAQTRLEVAVKNSGVSFDVAKPYIDQQTTAMNNLGFSTVDVYTALAKMTAATRDPQLALKSIAAAADLARFKNIDLATAGSIVARASVGQARGLADLGLAIGKTIPKGASFAEIMQLISLRTKDAAGAFRNTTTGALLVAQAQFKNLENQLGKELLPVLNRVLEWFNTKGIKGIQGFFGFIKNNQTAVKIFAGSLAGLWAVGKIIVFLEFLSKVGKMFKALKTGISEAYAPLSDFIKAATIDARELGGLKTAVGLFGKIGESVSRIAGPLGDIMILMQGVGEAKKLFGRLIKGFEDFGVSVVGGASGINPPSTYQAEPSTKVTQKTKEVQKNLNNPALKGVGNPLLPSATKKGKGVRGTKQSIAQQKAGTLTGNTNVTVTITTDHNATVKSITGSGGVTKVIKK